MHCCGAGISIDHCETQNLCVHWNDCIVFRFHSFIVKKHLLARKGLSEDKL
jgi:hypothetical protein